jgi:hypothetical protein
MGGLYNHTNHESEDVSRRASAALARGVAHVYEAVAAIEIRDSAAFATSKAAALEQLRTSRDLFSVATARLSDYIVKQRPEGSEIDSIFATLTTLGYGPVFNNRDIGSIPQSEIDKFISVFQGIDFPETSMEYLAIKRIIEAETRLVRVGLLVARFAALHPI